MLGLSGVLSTGGRMNKLIALLALASMVLAPAIADAKNVDISSWAKNVSESALGTEPWNIDKFAEIAVAGSTVHVVWVTDDAAVWDKRYIYYRRSTDGGATWEAKQEIYAATGGSDFFDIANRRLAVDGQNVHIFQIERRTSDSCSAYGASFQVITHFRSTDSGATFEAGKDAVVGGCNRNLFFTVPSAAAGKVTVGYTDAWALGAGQDYYLKVLTSEDNGSTFTSRTAFYTDVGDSRYGGGIRLGDVKALGDKIYAAFIHKHAYAGGGDGYLSDQYFAASSDRGATFTSNRISVPSNVLDSNGVAVHSVAWPQDYHNVPKIGAVGDNVYVTWTGADSDGIASAFFRRSTNSGVTFEDAINLSKPELPSGRISRWAQETIAAQGSHVYVVFVAVDASNGSGNGRVYIKSSTDSGATFSAMQELSPVGDPNVGGGWWPMVQTDPSVASGAKVHVLWNWATYDSSSDGGASFAGPILLAPAPFTQGDGARPQLTVGSDGAVHFVVERNIYSSFTWGDMDIFYRRLAPPPAPVATDSALSLNADGYVQRYDTMQVPASADTNFTSAMTAEAWIKPNRNADSSGYFIQKADPAISYRLGQWATGQADARITTVDGSYVLTPGDPIPNGAWAHVAMTYDAAAGADNFRVYVNGSLAGTQTATGNLKTGKGILLIGGNDHPYSAEITVDELRLWNKALTQTEIAANMVKTLQGSESGLTAYYNFNGTTKDITGRSNDGVLTYMEAYVPGVESHLSSVVTTTTSTSTTTTATTTTTTLSGSNQISFILGWNLMGNGSSGTLDVATAFGDGSKVTTVWKWIANGTKWAFYTPSLVGQALIDYATGKGYDVLSTINGGEGFWVNAKSAFSALLPAGTAISSSSFQSLASGWNLIAIGDNMTPAQFNALVGGAVPLTTVWAWDAAQTNWYFYAPSLDQSGGLANYISSKGYLGFGTKALDSTTGFWVNKP